MSNILSDFFSPNKASDYSGMDIYGQGMSNHADFRSAEVASQKASSSQYNPFGNLGVDVGAFFSGLGGGASGGGFDWGSLTSTLGGLGKAYLGMQSYKLAKDQYETGKKQFNDQFNAQAGLTNAELSDRQKLRNLEQPGTTMAEADYMSKYGVKTV